MTTTINASTSSGLVQTADTSGIIRIQSNGINTNALAWVNFNGITSVTIRSSYNVSSITRNGTGDYTVNYTNALADANYMTAFGSQQDDTSQPVNLGLRLTSDSGTGASVTTTAIRLLSSQAATPTDVYWGNVAIFGN